MLVSNQMHARGVVNANTAETPNPGNNRPAGTVAGSRPQSMQIFTAIGKGGGGKSTTLANLATVAAGCGLSVGVIDADPPQSLCQWRGTRGKSTIKVVPCGEGEDLASKVEDARRSGIQLLFIDTAPTLGEHTLAAIRMTDLVLVMTRPTTLDLLVTRRRVELLRTMSADFVCVINAAPPLRAGTDAPFVRQTRDSLCEIKAHPWRGQITHRHSIIQALIDGKGVIEAEPDNPATHEFVRLWAAIGERG